MPLVIYDEGGNLNRPYIASGAEGNTSAIEMYRNCTVNPHSGQTCWKMVYNASGDWGGVLLQNPPGNWGNRPGGWNLTGAGKLTFWARGENGGEVVTFSYGGLTGKHFNDSSSGSLPNVKLNSSWTQYSIDLQGKDLSDIITGFGWVVKPGTPTTFYLDDIRYE
jgi:hypothetical protein